MNGLERYFSDPAFVQWVKAPNAELEAYWKKWKEDNPDRIKELNEATALLKSIQFRQYPVNDIDIQRDWKVIKSEITSKSKKRSFFVFYRVAAVMLLLITATISFYLYVNTRKTEVSEVSYLEKSTLPGQKLSFQLPDGSFVKLNAESKLIYPSRFSDSSRIVELLGEGYFEVTKDPHQPFFVKSGDVVTKVLGTKFNVNGYDEERVEVALVEGSVEVSLAVNGNKRKTRISPRQKVSLRDDQLKVTKLNASDDIGWKDNILFFHKSNITEIKNILERWYNVEIVIEDADEIPETFNGEFQNDNLSNVLESIGYAMNFEYSIDNKKVYIKPKEK